ncbi:MAG: type III polyketide synthase [Planctomycetota bacterium]
MSLAITGTGVAVPPHTMTQAEALSLAEQVLELDDEKRRTLRAIYRRAGVQTRHTCVPYQTGFEWARLPPVECGADGPRPRGASTAARMARYREHAPPLAVAAAEQALAASGADPRGVTHVVTVSCTGFSAPGVDAALINRLGLSPETMRVNVGFMGCHGAINGLRTASALAAEDPRRTVLMVCVELCSLHYFFDAVPDKLVSNALFSDGAAALVGRAGDGVGQTGGGGAGHAWRALATGSFLLDASLELMGWEVGDHGFEMTLSPSVPERIATSLPPWIDDWLARHGVRRQEVAHWVVHPGGPRIVSAVAEALGLPPEATAASRAVLAGHGNRSSPTVLFIAEELRKAGASGHAVMLAFGPGLTAEVALLRFP